jgi:VWFA-related protein
VAALALAGTALSADPVALTVSGVQEQVGSMTVNITVTDDSGQESTLTADDTSATLDGKALRVTSIEKTNYGRQPASIVLLVDVSGSMYGNPIEQARAAVREFIGQMEPDDRIALMSFSTGVTLLQDFTSDRSLLDAAAGRLTAFGDTALFDAVMAGVQQSNAAPDGGKLIVLLSDGVATENLGNRAASLAAAEEANASVIAVGLGPSVDVDYLRELTSRTGGRYVQAASAARLRTAYAEIAKSVVRRYFSDYIMQVEVPPNVDRTVDGTLTIRAAVRGEEASSDLPLGPLEGAVPPPYTVRITGIGDGSTLSEAATAGVVAPAGREITSIEFLLDGQVMGSSLDPAATHALDPGTVEAGTHTFAVRTVDSKGGAGYGEVSFLVLPVVSPPPPAEDGGASLPVLPLLALLAACGIVYMLYRMVRARLEQAPEYVTRSLTPDAAERIQMAPHEEGAARPARIRAAARAQLSRIRGRVVVMRESAILAGDLHTTREYELGDAPLTIGTSPQADIVLEDDSGLIADEEARLWVQRGRVAFHRLTALSAMATAGVTPGWEFFDDGDELRIGPYRFVFKVEVNQAEAQRDEPTLGGMAAPQEHGMTLRPSESTGWDNR